MPETLPDTDYPAAHSMDTAWFAVDAHGYIGYFDTGEEGALPESDVTQNDIDTLTERLWNHLPATNVLHDWRGHYLPSGDRSWRGGPIRPGGTVLVFVSAIEPFAEALLTKRAEQQPATAGYALIWNRITPEEVALIYSSGTLLTWDFSFYDGRDGRGTGSLSRRGIFEYTHLTDNWISGPYGRALVPDVPVHIDQLEPSLRTTINQIQLPQISFVEGASFNPVKYIPCIVPSAYSGWEDVDGQRYPVPGDEDAFQPTKPPSADA